MKKEIKQIEFFIPKDICKMKSADDAFTEFSERGIKPDFSKISNPYRYHELILGKKRRGITIHELWEKGILDGSVPYWTLLGGENPKEILPKNIVLFMKKEIFKGKDKDLIEKTYQDILRYWTWWRKIGFYVSRIFNQYTNPLT